MCVQYSIKNNDNYMHVHVNTTYLYVLILKYEGTLFQLNFHCNSKISDNNLNVILNQPYSQ
jgi:hypothetical protein